MIIGWASVGLLLVFHSTCAQVSFLNGRFVASTDVSDRAKIWRDVEAIANADSVEVAINIYTKGENSVKADGSIRTLQQLATSGETKMMSEPEYVRFHHALTRTKAGSNDYAVPDYGNAQVLHFINEGEFGYAASSATSQILWMYTVHELRDAYKDCMQGDLNANEGNVKALEEAVAFYVGVEKTEGEQGSHSLYTLAQKTGKEFNTLNENGEAFANEKVIDLMKNAQDALTADIDKSSCVELRTLVNEVVGAMTVPLMQKLIGHLVEETHHAIREYALAVVPLIEGCNENDFSDLYDMLVTKFAEYNYATDFTTVREMLERSYPCLRIKCEHIGSYHNSSFAGPCSEPDASTPIAGYKPATDVRHHLRLDLDMLQLKLFMQSEAYDLAEDIYRHGRNSWKTSHDYRTLYDLATTSKRTVVPSYSIFTDYFGSEDYAHIIIMDALKKRGIFANASPAQRTEIVHKTAQYMVVYMYILRELYDAVEDCRNGAPNDNNGNVKAVDEAWAFTVGSIEGAEKGGYPNGQGLYALAKKRCEEFNMCGHGSVINDNLLALFRGAQSELNRRDCDALEENVWSIEPLLLAPLIQGTLRYAVINEKYEAGETDGDIAEGYVFSRSNLPLVRKADPVAAETIEENFSFDLKIKPVGDGADEVFDAYADVLYAMGIDCDLIGEHKDFGDLCDYEYYNDLSIENGAQGGNDLSTGNGAPGDVDGSSLSFLGGRYIATTDVSDRAAITRDVDAIRTASGIQEAVNIYKNGKNSVKADGSIRTLQDLATSGETKMMLEPEYVRFNHALTRTKRGTSDFATPDYANAHTLHYINEGEFEFGASSAVSQVLWMYTVHELRDAYADCMRGDMNANMGKVKAIDEAVAFYVGHGQTAGEENGNSLYKLAQSAAADFNTINDDGEALSNEKFISLMSRAQSQMTGENTDEGTCLEVRKIVNEAVGAMTVPLIQKLLTHMVFESHHKIREYALAVVPLIEGCNEQDFSDLYDMLIVNYDLFSYDRHFKDARAMLERAYPCLLIKCDQVGALNDASFDSPCVDIGPSEPIVGYVPATDVRHHLRLDLDVLQIKLFLQSEAYDLAEDLYTYGRNSWKNSNSYRTLVTLATTTKRTAVPSYSVFSDYFGSPDYADDIILQALAKRGQFAAASPKQIQEVVHKTIQYMVIYMYILRELYDAIDDCKSGTPNDNMSNVKAVDEAWAFTVGSIEGSKEGGFPHGQGFYSLAKKRCEEFSMCNNSGGSRINDRLLSLFNGAQSDLNELKCDELEEKVFAIEPLLLAPLIQGTLRYAVINEKYEAGETDGDIAEGYVFSTSHLPLASMADAAAADIIKRNMAFSVENKPVPDGARLVFSAYADVVDALGMDCTLIGKHNDFGDVCFDTQDNDEDTGSMEQLDDTVESIDPTEPTVLAGGLFVSSTNVDDRAMIAKDLLDMREALLGEAVTVAKTIYEKGRNSRKFDRNGQFNGKIRTFKGFSTNALEKMRQEPTFNIFLFALQDGDGMFQGKPVDMYANTYMEKMFDKSALAAEAAVALHLWMYTIHELEDALQDCKNAAFVSNADLALTDNVGGVLALDEAAAFYIGANQKAGDGKGPLLYALAESTAEKFGTKRNGQATVNTNVIRALNDAKSLISFEGACTAGTDTYEKLRVVVDYIKAQMAVPLIQRLIWAMEENEKERVKLYALAVVPLIAGCNPTTLAYLMHKLINDDFSAGSHKDIVAKLESTYPCLHISCEDIGEYKGKGTSCTDPDPMRPIAGYKPTTDVTEHAKIDLDILQIKVLMTMNATEAAKDIYLYGRNSMKGDNLRTLQNLATNDNRVIVPQYKLFRDYYGDRDYAHTLIMGALNFDKSSRFFAASVEQRTEAVVKTLQYQVMYMYILREMYDSVDDCLSGDPLRNAGSAKAWDEAVAFFVGSIEGTQHGGDPNGDGQLLYALHKKRCPQFQMCDDSGVDAKVNDVIMNEYKLGKADVEKAQCAMLRSKIFVVEPLLATGMVQGTLRYALINDNLPPGSKDGDLAEGDIFYTSIAPLVKDSDPRADETLKKNMEFQLKHSPVFEGSDDMFDAIAIALPGMGIDCKEIGVIDGMDVCPLANGVSMTAKASSSLGFSVVIAPIILVLPFITSFSLL